ncbi:hypothetical protein TRFO_12772 [Tritrichomonas foetus]|uniref:Prominin n=1 Tax=Tritrichomonas foetus TaxID=1144522 RepID=A0A1J4L0I0_9EUKA|nr:hypothetical protein TRFO_12772 [Tritrichomonas foetus]|eukprot:OHT16906.1 hypothetical protein TRFO_12772 [Tritrichomonas foetus]
MNSLAFLALLFTVAFCSDECEFEPLESIVRQMANIGQPCRGFLGKFGLKTIDTYPGPELFSSLEINDLLPYVLGCASLAVPFALLLVLLLLYFIIQCCCCCCPCCRPKTSSRPACYLSILHLISAVLLVASAILFFVSSANIGKGLKRTEKLPSSMDTAFHGIFDKVGIIFNNTFNVIDYTVLDLESNLKGLSGWMTESSEANVENAKSVIPAIVDYNNTFGNSTGPFKKHNATLYAGLNKTITSQPLTSNAPLLMGQLVAMEMSRQPATDAIIKLADTLKNTASEMKTTIENVDGMISDSLQKVKQQIGSFKTSSLTQSFDSFELQIDSIVEMLQPVETYIGLANQYITPVTYAATVILLAIAVFYGLIFFCRNCLSRCMVVWFPCFGAIVALFIVLPGVIFSALFFVLYDVCPDLENVAGSFMGDSTFGNITDLLLCPVEEPILDMINLSFDYEKIIDDFAGQASKQLQSFEIPKELTEKLDGFGDNFSIETNISSDHILFNHTLALKDIKDSLKNSQASNKTQLISDAEKMEEEIDNKESTIEKVRGLMTGVLDFGRALVPRVTQTQNDTVHLVDDFTKEAKDIIGGGINNITCTTIKCVYAPVKNALCVNLLSGMSYWLISSICLALGLILMSFTLCKRRRQMAKPRVKEASDSDSGELRDFNKRSR